MTFSQDAGEKDSISLVDYTVLYDSVVRATLWLEVRQSTNQCTSSSAWIQHYSLKLDGLDQGYLLKKFCSLAFSVWLITWYILGSIPLSILSIENFLGNENSYIY